MTEELPPDPFEHNPLIELDAKAMEVMEEGVDYFELFPNLFYDHIYKYARMHVEALFEAGVLDHHGQDREIATVLVHGIMIGSLSQQSPGFLDSLRDNI